MNINELYPSNYLKAADVKPTAKTATIKSVGPEEIAQGEHKPVVHFLEVNRGLVLNKTNGLLVASMYGPETDHWIGQRLELYCEQVPFQGKIVDSIRVRKPVVVAPQPAPAAPVDTAPAPAAPEKPADVVTELKAMDDTLNW